MSLSALSALSGYLPSIGYGATLHCGVLFPGRKSCYPLLLPEGGVGPPVAARAGQVNPPRMMGW